MYVMACLKTKKQNALMSNTSANACRETICTCYSFVTTKTPVIIHRGLIFCLDIELARWTNPEGQGRLARQGVDGLSAKLTQIIIDLLKRLKNVLIIIRTRKLILIKIILSITNQLLHFHSIIFHLINRW